MNDHYGMVLDPDNHTAKVHEAGHAVACFLGAKALNLDPHKVIEFIRVSGLGGGGAVIPTDEWVKGAYRQRSWSAGWNLRVTVAGCVAAARESGKTSDEEWQEASSKRDRNDAQGHSAEDIKKAAACKAGCVAGVERSGAPSAQQRPDQRQPCLGVL